MTEHMYRVTLVVFLIAQVAMGGEKPDPTPDKARLYLELTVGQCSKELEKKLPEKTHTRLSPEELAHHNPTNVLLSQRIQVPSRGRVSQSLQCDEFTIVLDLRYGIYRNEAIRGGISSSVGRDGELIRPSHWNCFSIALGKPLYMGHVKRLEGAYLIVGRFSIIDKTRDAAADPAH